MSVENIGAGRRDFDCRLVTRPTREERRACARMEDEMTTNDVFPLLELPAGVERVLLPFVASGTGGLQAILNLRRVCSTTKSWVDTLPTRQGKPLFSKAQIRMDTQVCTLKRFLKSAPPFPVSALSVNFIAILDKNPPAEEEELWSKFCTFWTPRLETLELRKEWEQAPFIYHIFSYRKIVCLVESPNLKVLRLNSFCVQWNKATPIPSSLYKLHELSISFTGPHEENGEMKMKHFYWELKKNPNLRKLETSIHNVAEYECLQKFIDAKKDDARLELNLHLNDAFPEDEDDDVEDEDGVKYLKFAKSVVASKSTIRLQTSYSFRLENVVAFLPRHIALEMFQKVEVIETWEPSGDTLSLLEDLPRLKEVTVETERDGVNFERLTFPPSLENLTFTWGFPARAALPEALRSLTLDDFSCNATEFVNSLNLLKAQCARLETLNITWKCEGLEPLALEFEIFPGFASLRSLTFMCDPSWDGVETYRAVLSHGFQVEALQLRHLSLRFNRFIFDWRGYLPMLDAPFLTRLCEGPVRNSLLKCDIKKWSVTPDGLPMLERLASLAAGNVKRREEREGGGRWQRQAFIK